MASRSIEFEVIANDKASAKLRTVKDAVSELGTRIGQMFTATALFDRALGYLERGVSAFVQSVKDAAAINDLAKAAGLTNQEYQRLGIAAQDAGLSQEQMMKGLKTMKEALRDARVEGSRQAQVFAALGYSQEQIASGSIEAIDAMTRLSAAVGAATTPQEKYNIAASVFGTKAQELIPLLDDFRAAMQRASKETIISDETIDKLDKFDKLTDRAKRRGSVISATAASFAMTPEGGALVGNALLPGIGSLQGRVAGMMLQQALKDNNQAPAPVTQADKDAANALGKLGRTAATGGSAGMAGISSAQSLGMATSIALAQQQTAYLATIAANTSPSMGGVIPGGTNITRPDATASELRDVYNSIRYTTSPTSKLPRPAR